jgi:hypothetical protein
MTDTRIINIPFSGFYESLWSSEIDHHEEQEAEHFAERQAEEGIPEPLRLDGSDFAELLFECADYRKIHEAIAKTYAEAFNNVISEAIGVELGMTFESMTSPRYYNFETDRIFCHIPEASVAALFELSKLDGHKALAKVLEGRHTSYDGFHSFYDNDVAAWLEKPLEDWDHNELCSLLLAAMLRAGIAEDWQESVFYAVVECDGIFHEYDAGMDWAAFDEKVAERRADKRTELEEVDPAAFALVVEAESRCPNTLDLFQR